MYNIIKSVIETENYELRDMLKKIDTLWVKGSITEDERAELIALAQGKAQVGNSVDVLAKLAEHDREIREIKDAIAKMNTSEGDTDEEVPEEVSYPEYVVGKLYYAGDTVMFKGTAYECIAPEGAVCVWNPEEYPTYWQAKTE